MLSMPYRSSAESYLRAPGIFDIRTTPSRMGIISEDFRRMPGVNRSLNPAHPVLCVGPDSELILRDHENCLYSCGENSPFQRALKLNGKVLFFDTSLRKMTFFHYLEDTNQDLLPVPLYKDQLFRKIVRDARGSEREVGCYVFSEAARSHRTLRILGEEMKRRNTVHTFRVGGTQILLCRLKEIDECVKEIRLKGRRLY